jgi:hypothetical protein
MGSWRNYPKEIMDIRITQESKSRNQRNQDSEQAAFINNRRMCKQVTGAYDETRKQNVNKRRIAQTKIKQRGQAFPKSNYENNTDKP